MENGPLGMQDLSDHNVPNLATFQSQVQTIQVARPTTPQHESPHLQPRLAAPMQAQMMRMDINIPTHEKTEDQNINDPAREHFFYLFECLGHS